MLPNIIMDISEAKYKIGDLVVLKKELRGLGTCVARITKVLLLNDEITYHYEWKESGSFPESYIDKIYERQIGP